MVTYSSAQLSNQGTGTPSLLEGLGFWYPAAPSYAETRSSQSVPQNTTFCDAKLVWRMKVNFPTMRRKCGNHFPLFSELLFLTKFERMRKGFTWNCSFHHVSDVFLLFSSGHYGAHITWKYARARLFQIAANSMKKVCEFENKMETITLKKSLFVGTAWC